jgi:multiple sugar transport system permease protein
MGENDMNQNGFQAQGISTPEFGGPVIQRNAWIKGKKGSRFVRIGLTIFFLLLGSFLFLLPFYWLFITAIKPTDQLFTTPPVFWPREFLWSNFIDVWSNSPFATYVSNTSIITLFNILGNCLVASVVGYGFAVAKFRGKNFLFIVLLGTMMIPPQITLIPLFVMYRNVHWIDTLYPLIVPTFFGVGSAFYIFLMRQFFLGIPIELEEAARMDGANTLQILRSIYLPLSVPALMTIVIFSFVGSWNDFFGPLIFLTSQKNWTLTLGLSALANPMYIDYRVVMAGAVIVSIPCIAVFFLAQRFFTEGISLTGIKG